MIQQDIAMPHVLPHDSDVVAAGMEAQRAGLRAVQNRVPIHGIDNPITVVQTTYKDMRADTLTNIFLTMQDCMRCVLRQKGGNQYTLPNIGKAKLRRKGILSRVLSCDQHLYDSAKAVLAESDRGSPPPPPTSPPNHALSALSRCTTSAATRSILVESSTNGKQTFLISFANVI
ncbi:hypothetical protein JG687_00002141 [Phytophthora cactorum]|uniref:Uncharacterized protein n=1 Tax=Phytophthora cactorum TaxID=29920 RepID=A0A8T1UZY3_9STRA|nr:hypothetical protein JG687_00002141 [Phytophthora cactorum]